MAHGRCSQSRWARRALGRASNLTSSPLGRCRNTVKRRRRGRRARPWPPSPTRLPRGRSRCRAAAREVPRGHVRWNRAASRVRNPERSRACRRPRVGPTRRRSLRPIKTSRRWRTGSKRHCANRKPRPKDARLRLLSLRPRRPHLRTTLTPPRPRPRQGHRAPRALPEERPAPAQAEARPKEGKALYDSLEQEMASLLGRPAGKI